MPTNDKKPDRATIVFGPTKNNTSKAIAQKQKQLSTDTQDSTTQNILNNPTFNFAGGSGTLVNGTVAGYNASAQTGTVVLDSDSSTVSFTNATGINLVPDDYIAMLRDTEGSYVAIAVISRANRINPTTVPPVTLNTSYPIRTDNLTNSFRSAVVDGQYMVFDGTGNFGLGVGLIIGAVTSSSTSANAFDSINGISYGLGTVGASLNYLSTTGVLFSFDGSSSLYYRDKYSGTATTIDTNAKSVVMDNDNGNLWINQSTISPYTFVIPNGSTTRVAGTTTSPGASRPVYSAGNGYLHSRVGTSTVYVKSSLTYDDWTVLFTGSVIPNGSYASGPNGEFYVAYESGGYIMLNCYTAGIVKTYNTGLDGTLSSSYVGVHDMTVSSTNVVYMLTLQRADILGTGTSSENGMAIYGCIITSGTPTNPSFAPTTMLYTDGSMNRANPFFMFGNSLQTVGANTLLWQHTNSVTGSSESRIYALTI